MVVCKVYTTPCNHMWHVCKVIHPSMSRATSPAHPLVKCHWYVLRRVAPGEAHPGREARMTGLVEAPSRGNEGGPRTAMMKLDWQGLAGLGISSIYHDWAGGRIEWDGWWIRKSHRPPIATPGLKPRRALGLLPAFKILSRPPTPGGRGHLCLTYAGCPKLGLS